MEVKFSDSVLLSSATLSQPRILQMYVDQNFFSSVLTSPSTVSTLLLRCVALVAQRNIEINIKDNMSLFAIVFFETLWNFDNSFKKVTVCQL